LTKDGNIKNVIDYIRFVTFNAHFLNSKIWGKLLVSFKNQLEKEPFLRAAPALHKNFLSLYSAHVLSNIYLVEAFGKNIL